MKRTVTKQNKNRRSSELLHSYSCTYISISLLFLCMSPPQPPPTTPKTTINLKPEKKNKNLNFETQKLTKQCAIKKINIYIIKVLNNAKFENKCRRQTLFNMSKKRSSSSGSNSNNDGNKAAPQQHQQPQQLKQLRQIGKVQQQQHK